MTRAVVGLGSNLGDRLATLREAVRRVGAFAEIRARSHVWETEPVGGPPQGEFLNAAILVEYNGPPEALLDALLGVEASLGRERREQWGPRTIDLDVLWIEGVAVDAPRLVVPHKRLRERAFALAPLLEVAPQATDPKTGDPYVVASLAGVCRTDDVV